MGEVDVSPFRWGWFHTYKAVGMKHVATYEYESDKLPYQRKTLLLGRCTKCGRPSIKKLKGNWTNIHEH
jgi:hypothetical protein